MTHEHMCYKLGDATHYVNSMTTIINMLQDQPEESMSLFRSVLQNAVYTCKDMIADEVLFRFPNCWINEGHRGMTKQMVCDMPKFEIQIIRINLHITYLYFHISYIITLNITWANMIHKCYVCVWCRQCGAS